MKTRQQKQGHRGGALAFSVVLFLVLIMVGACFFVVSLYFGGAQETKDAVNAGALNVAKEAVDISVDLNPGTDQNFFRDVADSGKISLRNINRVWGKALMVAMNAEAAQQDAGNAGSGSASADSVRNAALQISTDLSQKLSTEANLHGFFDAYASANSVRMLGMGAKVEKLPGADWDTSFVERNFESNLEFKNNLPVGYSKPEFFTASKRTPVPQDAIGKKFLLGYSPLKVLGQNYWQVPFPFHQKPHILDRKIFMDNKTKPLAVGGAVWQTAVPNAFGVAGQTKQSATYNETAVSWVEANPQKTFPLQFPNGFIRIKVKKNTLQWNINGIPGNTTDYGFVFDTKDSIQYPIGCGSMSAKAFVGLEYIPPTLYRVVTALPPINGSTMDYLLQRCKEMVPDLTMGELIAAMNLCLVNTSAEDQTFFIYPVLNNTKVVATSESMTVLPTGCDKNANPEGSDQTLDTEPSIPAPNFALETLNCYGSYTFPTLTLCHGERTWKPGTGFKGGCLGELTIKRETDVYLFGACPCP